jgi:hypothetical protein
MQLPTIQAVGWGVDTLKVSAVGNLKADVVTLLSALQQEAIAQRDQRRHKGEVMLDTHWALDGQPLLLLPHGGGRGQWTYIMTCPAATFEMGPGHLNGICCQVRLSSAFLWQHGYRTAWALVRAFLAPLCEAGTWFQASEVHLCADIAGVHLDKLRDVQFVTRSQVARWHKEDALVLHIAEVGKTKERPQLQLVKRYRQQETLTFSPRGDVEVQVYDKPREIRRKSPDKAWFGDIWARHGWNGADPVARVEVRLKRAALHELGCETVEDTFNRLDSVWRYVTLHWICHTVPNRKQSCEWPESTFWRVVQAVTFEHEDAEPAERNKVRQFKEQQMLAAIMGYLESWAAWQGDDDSVPGDLALEDVFGQIGRRHKEHYQHKGTSFRDEVIRKRKAFGITPGEQGAAGGDGENAVAVGE